MNEKIINITRRKALKRGAYAVAGVVGVAALGSIFASCSNDSLTNSIDPDIYSNHGKIAKADDVITRNPLPLPARPNIIIILTDDMGYGDAGVYGGRSIKTPQLDKMAKEGVRFTDFYCSSPLCSPSRAGLLTGRYPLRSGISFPLQPGKDTFMRKTVRQVGYFMGSLGACDLKDAENISEGLPGSEITIARALKIAGYKTAAIGKWHLGDFTVKPEYHPHNYGFDRFVGFNASNDDWPAAFWIDKKEVLKDIALDQGRFTGLFTNEAIDFIDKSGKYPFFIYLAHKDPHQPCIPSAGFKGKSEGGPHGDTIEEVDWNVGRIIRHLKKRGLDDNTLIIFTSDNGPWYNGSVGGLRGRKGESYEGGFRIPMIARFPGKIPPGKICAQPAMNIDFFPTILRLAGLVNPSDRIIDGRDIWGLLSGRDSRSPHDALFFFHYREIEGLRSGKWKFIRNINTKVWPIPMDKKNTFFGKLAAGHDYKPEGSAESFPTMASWPILYDMSLDKGESYNLIRKYPEIGREMLSNLEKFEDQLYKNPRGWVMREKK